MDPDHDPRGQPRLGRVGHGGLHRVRHRVHPGRRGDPAAHLRLRRTDARRAGAGPGRDRAPHRARRDDQGLHAPQGRDPGLLEREDGHAGRQAHAVPVAVPVRPAERRPGRLGGPGRRRRHVRHRRRAGRGLLAELVGRAAELPARDDPGERARRTGRGPGQPPAERLVDQLRRVRLQRHQPQRRQGPGRAGGAQLHPDDAPPGELPHGPRPDQRHHRRHRPLLLRRCLPPGRVDGDGGVQRLVLHHRHHLPGGQPAAADDGQGRRRRRQHPQHHRVVRTHGLGCARVRPDRQDRRAGPAQRRHRRHRQLRHDAQRAGPPVRGRRGLAAGCVRPARGALRPRELRHHGRTVRRQRAVRAGSRRLLCPGQAAEHVRHGELEPADGLHRPGRRRQPPGARGGRERARADPVHRRRLPVRSPAVGAVRPVPHRPGDVRCELRRGGGRQLRLRRRLRGRDAGRHGPQRARVRRRGLRPADRR